MLVKTGHYFYEGGGGRHLGGGNTIMHVEREGERQVMHISGRGYENSLR